MNKKYASLNINIKAVDKAKYQIRAVFSTPDEDRQGEIIDQKGWKLTEFLLNPVVLWGHDDSQPAIGKVVDLAFVDGNLEGTIQFAVEEYEFAKTIYNLYAGEYIRAISVGFMNDKWMYDEEKDLIVLLENNLFEVSCVNVPANALALAKSKGLDVSPYEKRLDKAKQVNNRILEKSDDKQEEEVEEPKEEAAVVPPVEVKEPEVTAEKALEILLNSDSGAIRAAVKQLSNRSDAAERSQSGSTIGAPKKYLITQVNRVVRHLLKSK